MGRATRIAAAVVLVSLSVGGCRSEPVERARPTLPPATTTRGTVSVRAPLPSGTRVIGYYKPTTMNEVARVIPDATLAGLTDVIFSVTIGDDSCRPSDVDAAALDVLGAMKHRVPTLRVLVGIAGGANVAAILGDDGRRADLVSSCTRLLSERSLDGFDVDWEFPDRERDQRAVVLMRELRTSLDSLGRGHLELTMAVPAMRFGWQRYDWRALEPVVDAFTVMTYELGPIHQLTSHHTALYPPVDSPSADTAWSVDDAITALVNDGAPASKLLLGLAFYAHVWHGVAPSPDGLYQRFDAPPRERDYYIDYRDVVDHPPPGGTRRWDERAHVPWIYDPTTATTISYDDAQSLRDKVAYARDHRLAGVMIFRVEEDDDNSTLFNAVYDALR